MPPALETSAPVKDTHSTPTGKESTPPQSEIPAPVAEDPAVTKELARKTKRAKARKRKARLTQTASKKPILTLALPALPASSMGTPSPTPAPQPEPTSQTPVSEPAVETPTSQAEGENPASTPEAAISPEAEPSPTAAQTPGSETPTTTLPVRQAPVKKATKKAKSPTKAKASQPKASAAKLPKKKPSNTGSKYIAQEDRYNDILETARRIERIINLLPDQGIQLVATGEYKSLLHVATSIKEETDVRKRRKKIVRLQEKIHKIEEQIIEETTLTYPKIPINEVLSDELNTAALRESDPKNTENQRSMLKRIREKLYAFQLWLVIHLLLPEKDWKAYAKNIREHTDTRDYSPEGKRILNDLADKLESHTEE